MINNIENILPNYSSMNLENISDVEKHNPYQIYSLNCPYNPEIVRYIGYTKKTLNKRLAIHMAYLYTKSHKISWIKKLKSEGVKPLIVLIEDNLTIEKAKEKEIEYIKLFKSFGARLTNSTIGGEGAHGYKHTEERKLKISIANKGKTSKLRGTKFTEEHKKNISQSLKGKKKSNEHRENIRLSRLGKKLTEEHKQKISKGNLGKVLSEQTKQKMSESKIGRIVSEEVREKIRQSLTGIKLSEETRAKMRGRIPHNKGKKGSKISMETLEKRKKSRIAYWERVRQERLTMIF